MPELTITSNPPGAEVQLDGISMGTAPVTITIGEVHSEPPSYTLAFTESFDMFGPPSMSLDFTEHFDDYMEE